MDENTTSEIRVSVIIPVYRENAIINGTIRHVREVAGDEPVEIVVSDGGPGHKTLAVIEDDAVVRVQSASGRGLQLNAGAAMASGDILLFLHADTRLPPGALAAIRRVLADDVVAGAFSLSIDSPRLSLKVVTFFANLRSRLERVPYGDQAQFVRADVFREQGGYKPIPIMEDVEFFRRLREATLPIVVLSDKVSTSSRRWEDEGVLRRTLGNWRLRLRYWLGASPHELASDYRPHHKDTT